MEFLHAELLSTDSIHLTARGFVDAVIDGDGATAHLHRENWLSTGGYMVGGAVSEITVPVSVFDGRIAYHGICELILSLENTGKHADAFGVWVEDGMVYMDASNFILDIGSALSIARSRGEISIYDRANGEVIYTATGTTEPANVSPARA